MTSVNSYDSATSAGNYTLVFSGTFLGDWIDSYSSVPAKATPTAVRQNFWANQVILDNSYPALVHNHTFVLYTESGSLAGYFKRYHGLATHLMKQRPYPLQIWSGTTTPVVVDFGSCVLESIENSEELLLYNAGKITLSFQGTQVPSVLI